MDEILVSKKWVIIVLVLIGPGADVLCDIPQVRGCGRTNASAQSTLAPAEDEQTGLNISAAQKGATTGAQAFYTVDYQKGQQPWLHVRQNQVQSG